MSFMREDSAYRRGTVLGLTFAEIMLLLLFVLLIALSFFLQRKEQEVADIRQNLTAARQKVDTLTSQLEIRDGKDPVQNFNETFHELVIAKSKIDSQKDQIKKLNEAGDKNRAIADAVKDTGLPSDPEKLTEALTDLRELEMLAIQAIGEKAEAEQRLQYFIRRAGLSNELPPCWITSGSAEYIFDITLGSGGMTVHPRPPEHRKMEMADLPLDGVRYEKPIDVRTFRKMFRPLNDWSEKQQCKFFVRAFDRTEPHEKVLFKRLLLTTEGFFYKYLVKDPSIRPGDISG